MTNLPTIYKTRQMFEVEGDHDGRDIRLILVDLYNSLGTTTAVAEKLGVSQPTIQNWFEALGITVETKTVASISIAI